ncbi:MAG: dTMP kinase [Anaerolineae bacterium]|nr:dTMP kinase [Caldilineales bacterium]MDW8268340.1 dTMP kinase [Anaerolineae bacterium]
MAFITFEGIEGSGKTTQMQLLRDWLQARGEQVLATREPGGTAIGDRIRAILLDPNHTEMAAETEILLYAAARAQIVRQIIRPHLEQGWIVLCDRFFDSTLAYQGYGRGLPLNILRDITAFATGGLVPDLTFYLDLPVEVGLRRKAQTPAEWTRFEAETLAFHRRVRKGYLELAAAEPRRWVVLDAGQPAELIQETIRQEVLARGVVQA